MNEFVDLNVSSELVAQRLKQRIGELSSNYEAMIAIREAKILEQANEIISLRAALDAVQQDADTEHEESPAS